MIVWFLQLTVQSVPIIIEVVCSSPVHDEVYSIQHYVIKFVSDLRQVYGFLWAPVSSINKTEHHNILEIMLKVALKHHKPPQTWLLLTK